MRGWRDMLTSLLFIDFIYLFSFWQLDRLFEMSGWAPFLWMGERPITLKVYAPDKTSANHNDTIEAM